MIFVIYLHDYLVKATDVIYSYFGKSYQTLTTFRMLKLLYNYYREKVTFIYIYYLEKVTVVVY